MKQLGKKSREKEYVGFTDIENAYDKVNREDLWHALKIYDVGGKLLIIATVS